jgi:hypothetical protein
MNKAMESFGISFQLKPLPPWLSLSHRPTAPYTLKNSYDNNILMRPVAPHTLAF